jgi:hypothetical protein
MLKRITLRLARNSNFPQGDDRQGYTLIAPLDSAGQLDAAAWRQNRDACRVFRFHPDAAEHADGWLRRRGQSWYFHYDEDDEGDDESGFKLGTHVFRAGEYVTVSRHGNEPLAYRVTDVSDAP